MRTSGRSSATTVTDLGKAFEFTRMAPTLGIAANEDEAEGLKVEVTFGQPMTAFQNDGGLTLLAWRWLALWSRMASRRL